MIASLLLAGTILGHSHNDYERAQPFWEAREAGMASFEADIYLVGGELCVSHDRKDIKPDRTLTSLYLEPMAKALSKGSILPRRGQAVLMIDIKADGKEVFPVLLEQLRRYPRLISARKNSPVKVVISGDRPFKEITEMKPRLMWIDGRLTDLDDPNPAIAWISDNWMQSFSYAGLAPFKESEAAKLRAIAAKAAAKKRLLRFWAAPDSLEAWKTLTSSGVTIISTDHPKELGDWLRSPRPSTAPPPHANAPFSRLFQPGP